ncbi:MAG: hypothetical protein M1828_002867 [Chrysothrix sp. TS-e1954]|nr:MAG: hypothetical protein M1828_002867 [Chrysothrix sp. TS-e1954]
MGLSMPVIELTTRWSNTQVLFKRSPIDIADPPKGLHKDAQLWVLDGTDEAFSSYEDYLERYDYYMQACAKKFTCEITGHTGMTYWDAFKSEREGSKEVETNFPERLRGPVLSKVNFSTISRIDELVAWLFDVGQDLSTDKSFKEDFFPGETVAVIVPGTGDRTEGTIREKTTFPEHRGSDGLIEREVMVRYFITLDHDEIAVQDQKHLSRGRRAFTKQVLRSFLKNTISRDRFDGAPWTVKQPYASEHNISTQVPPHLRYDAILAEKKSHAVFRKADIEDKLSQFLIDSSGNVVPRAGVSVSSHQVARVQKSIDGAMASRHAKPGTSHKSSHHRQETVRKGSFDKVHSSRPDTAKYPIDDLDLPPERAGKQRPGLRTIQDYIRDLGIEMPSKTKELESASMGILLGIWNTLNVFGEFFCLSSFTFDDFVQAMLVTSEDVDCELLREIHCAILKKLINHEGSILTSSLVDPQSDPSQHSSRDSSEASEVAADISSHGTESRNLSELNESAADDLRHQARRLLSVESWKERLKAREFQDGGWQYVLLGVLDRMSSRATFTTRCEKVIAELLSMDSIGQGVEGLRHRYALLSVSQRITALELVTLLATETKPFKESIEHITRGATETRKEKTKLQSVRKTLVARLAQLDQERKLSQPDEMPKSPGANGQLAHDREERDINHNDRLSHTTGYSSDDSNEDAPPSAHASRRIRDRDATVKRKREEEDERKDLEAKKRMGSKETAKYNKFLRDIQDTREHIAELQEQIAEKDNELRENSCFRTKVLGFDRFGSRYVWFERNGMPLKGDPESSSASAVYANGCLWVQGPYKLNNQGTVDAHFWEERQHGMTLADRRRLEEAPPILRDADDWGWYGTAKEVDGLVDWLDQRGERERALRRELCWWREEIVDCIGRRERHFADRAAKQATQEERPVGVATRKKTAYDQYEAKYQCLSWHNHAAINSLKHLHSESARESAPKKNKRAVEIRIRDTSAAPDKSRSNRGFSRSTR